MGDDDESSNVFNQLNYNLKISDTQVVTNDLEQNLLKMRPIDYPNHKNKL